MKTVIQMISTAVSARKGCIIKGNKEWESEWNMVLEYIENDVLPRGSGIDAGCNIDRDKSEWQKIKINVSFHHMNENGYYDGWTDHVLTVFPMFDGIDISISGKDKNGIKDYLADVFYDVLQNTYVPKYL